MPSVVTTYQCSICSQVYPDEAAAAKCEARGIDKPVVANGDIVLLKAGFGWFDGDSRWIENHAALGGKAKNYAGLPGAGRKCPNGDGNCFGPCCTYQFYYVVTAIDSGGIYPHERHRTRYHVFTGAMTGEQGHQQGWTYNDGHIKPRLVEHPPEVLRELAKAFIGQKASFLL